MQHLDIQFPCGHIHISADFWRVPTQVRFFALRRIEPHAPPLVRAPVNSFELGETRGGLVPEIPVIIEQDRSIKSRPHGHLRHRRVPGGGGEASRPASVDEAEGIPSSRTA